LWAWGRNNLGQLGDGTGVNKSSPIQVGALTTWSQIAAGAFHNAAIKTDGTLWSWGQNSYYGQLGDNTNINKSSPIQVGALTTWSQIVGGANHTAAIKIDGTLWAWGLNNNGQLGDGTRVDKSSPVQVGALVTWSKIVAGQSHTVAIKTDGTLWVWGQNNSGQLGQNNTINRSSPVQVGAMTTWFTVAKGPRANHTVAITKG
jgi:alpha-tubulin suppressor-like RCC1 family protein